VAGVERRLRVVLDVELDRLGPLSAGDLAGQPQARSRPAETPAAVTTLPAGTIR
jgi:hypothetical protein